MPDSESFADSPTAAEPCEPEQPEQKKRNCGRTGPTSPEGRAASSKNSMKHGACSRTLILPTESEEDWEKLLAKYLATYQPAEDSLEYDFVLKTAQAEWHRQRIQRYYDSCMCNSHGFSIFNWSPEQIKQHELAHRYKNAAERAYQREFRMLEQYYKTHRPQPAPKREPAPKPQAAPKSEPFVPAASRDQEEILDFYMEDETSPTGETFLFRFSGPPLPGDPRYPESTPAIHPPPAITPAADPPAS